MRKLTELCKMATASQLRPIVQQALLVVCAALIGCSAAPGKAPETPEAPEPGYGADTEEEAPSSVEGAEADFERAEAELLAVLGDASAAGGARPLSPYAEPPPAADGEPAEAPAQPQRAETYGTRSRCGVACRALGSMRRAATRLCSIAGSDDPRCDRAEQRVAYATDLVRRSCSTCG